MPADLDQMNPEMEPQSSPTEQSAVVGLHSDELDHEGAMAKADLYKLANYSMKLFKQVHDDDQLEAWVQAKITKAADYIASVYHYLEYEMKFSEYGKHLDNSDTLSEGQRMKIKELLSEAKSKMKDLKKTQAEKAKDKKVMEGPLRGGEQQCTECGGTGMVYVEAMPIPDHVKKMAGDYDRKTKAMHAAHKRLDKNHNGIPDSEEDLDEEFTDKSKTGDTFKTRTGTATKTDTGMKHTNTTYHDDGDEISSNAKSGKGIKTHAKSQSAAEKKEKAPAQKMSPKSAKTWGMKDSEKFDNRDKVDEAKKKGDGNLANNAKPYDKVTRGDVISGRLGKDEEGGKKKVKEAAKPSEGLSAAKKSAVVKKAKAGGDIGKPGKSFDKVAKSAGGGEKGEKIAAAAMWKNIKETQAYLAEKKKKEKITDENLTVVPNPSGAKDAEEAKKLGAMMPAPAGKKDPIGTNESSDLSRMRELTGRLNQNERTMVAESGEVASIRALTKRLLG
jgi:hypothetical protein